MTSTAAMDDAQLARHIMELGYRVMESRIDPTHPASRANGARWARELRAAQAAQRRRAS
jgi:hypothetical protein